METINSLVGVLLRTAIEWVCFRRLLFSSVTMVMKLITSFLFKHVLVTYKSVPEKSPWACIPNFCHSAFNLEYRRDVCSWSCHYLLQDSVFLYVLQESKGKQTRYFILAGSGVALLPSASSASVVQRRSACRSGTDCSPERAWVCSAPPSSPLVTEKGHLYLEIANQPGNHHAEIAPMKIKQCYIWSLNHVYL